jgi:DNA polymerase III delta prime subunit
LKIIEEPADNTHMFIVVPDSSALLGTILSRVQVIKTNEKGNKDIKKEATNFILASPVKTKNR